MFQQHTCHVQDGLVRRTHQEIKLTADGPTIMTCVGSGAPGLHRGPVRYAQVTPQQDLAFILPSPPPPPLPLERVQSGASTCTDRRMLQQAHQTLHGPVKPPVTARPTPQQHRSSSRCRFTVQCKAGATPQQEELVVSRVSDSGGSRKAFSKVRPIPYYDIYLRTLWG